MLIKEEQHPIPYYSSDLPKGKALIFAPHPDDEIFGCGGAILRHLQQGDKVRVVIVTDGGLPVNDGQKTLDYHDIRKQESLAAAEVLGYGQPQFLDFQDGFLKADDMLISRLIEIIQEFEPQNIYLPADTEIHTDHIALNVAGIEAVRRYPDTVNLFFYEIGQPLRPNFFIDVTGLQPTLEKAMDCFVSQLAAQDYKTHVRSLHAYRSYTLGKDVKFAEAYRMIKSDELKTGEILWQERKQIEVAQPSELKNNEDLPLISVIVRTMNRPQLPEALESIAAQTYPNIEVIVVDAKGEKPLDLGDRCDRFPLRVISQSKPLNRPKAANAGLDAVKGNYFSFLDEDDLLDKNHFEKLFSLLRHSNALVAYSGIKVVDKNDGLLMILNEEFVKEKLLWGNFIPIHALLFTTKPIKNKCQFDVNNEVFEDWDFLLQAAIFTDFIHYDEITGIYRNANASGLLNNSDEAINYKKRIFNKWKNRLNEDEYYKFICYLAENNLLNNSDYFKYFSELQRANELEKQLKRANDLIEGVLASHSWKITAPFRKISEILKMK